MAGGDEEIEEVRGHFSDLATLPLMTHHRPLRTEQLSSHIPRKVLHDQKGAAGSRWFEHRPPPAPPHKKRDLLGVKQGNMSCLPIKAQTLFHFGFLGAGGRE